MVEDSLLDSSPFYELCEIDPTLASVKEILTMFLTQTPGHLASIASGMREKDYIKVQREAHFLKSSGGNLGAITFSRICDKLEQLDNWNPPDMAQELIKQMEEEFIKAKAALLLEMDKAMKAKKGNGK